MKVLLVVFTLCFAAPCIAGTNQIGCPKGTKPSGETTPEVSEAWCEISKEGKTVQHGPYRAWWPNGKLGTEGQYEYGKAVGHWRGWYETGELQGEEWFENGSKVKARYFDKKGNEIQKRNPNPQLVPTPGTARHVSWGFRGRRGTAARWALLKRRRQQ